MADDGWIAAAKKVDGHGSADEDTEPPRIFGVPLHESIKYANVAISLTDADGRSFIYGYVPIVVAKCGVFLKEKGGCPRLDHRITNPWFPPRPRW